MIKAQVAHNHGFGILIQGDGPKRADLYAPAAPGAASLFEFESVSCLVHAESIFGAGLDAGTVPAELTDCDSYHRGCWLDHMYSGSLQVEAALL